MQFSEFLQISWQSIVANKMRSLLTVLGVIIGVAAVIVMISISAGTEAAIEDQITGLGSNLIYINRSFGFGRPGAGSSSGGLVYDDAFAIEEVEGVAGVTVEQSASESIRAGETTLDDVTILGTTADYPSVRDIEIAAGRYFRPEEVEAEQRIVVLGAGIAETLFGKSNPLGQTIRAGTTRLIVVGVFEERGTVSGVDFDAQIYVPIMVVFEHFVPTQFARIFGNNVRTIFVEVERQDDMEPIISRITTLLARRHEVSLDELDFSVTTQQDIIETQESATAAFRNLLAWVAGVSLIVGGIGIMNIMLVSVTERTGEIGIRQAVGATPNDVRFQFLTEALLLSVSGGLLGVIAGLAGSWVFGRVSDLPISVIPGSVLLAFGSAAAVGVFFGFYPANQAAELDPIEALRHE